MVCEGEKGLVTLDFLEDVQEGCRDQMVGADSKNNEQVVHGRCFSNVSIS